jgi:hypothetical protein
VLLVMGQSNATGTQADKTTDYVPNASVLVWDGAALVHYAPNDVSGIEWGGKSGHWSAELGYVLRYRAAYPTRRLVIVKFTAASTQLDYSGEASRVDWNPRSPEEHFARAAIQLRAALAAVRANHGEPNIRLLWWQQGENDTAPGLADRYRDNLAAFVTALRDRAGAFALPVTTAIVVGRLSIACKTWHADGRNDECDVIRAAQKSVADSDIGGPSILLNTDDVPMDPDRLHFSKAALLALGDRLWAIDQGSYVEP